MRTNIGQEFEYRRHGTASLIAALDVRSGEILTEVITRNDAATFTAFLDQLDEAIASSKQIHVVLDNGSSPTARHTKAWPAAHPRRHARWAPPHAPWLNHVVGGAVTEVDDGDQQPADEPAGASLRRPRLASEGGKQAVPGAARATTGHLSDEFGDDHDDPVIRRRVPGTRGTPRRAPPARRGAPPAGPRRAR
ncbi:transposase [Streptomyces sp. NPDC058239]|uniref:transposase n=1 Tax=unclassified Streptomyces TaxID=2593676 RepID=UPI00365A6798